MLRIAYRSELSEIERDGVPDLRQFFRRLRRIRRDLGTEPYLNRLQRRRCLDNLRALEEMEREFHAVEYREDYLELHRSLRRYLYLETIDLARVLGSERVKKRSLFLPVG